MFVFLSFLCAFHVQRHICFSICFSFQLVFLRLNGVDLLEDGYLLFRCRSNQSRVEKIILCMDSSQTIFESL